METKGALQSKTILGIILATLGTFMEFAPQLMDALPSYAPYIQKGMVFAGLALALYGRVTAATEVKGILPTK